ncbi:hypothetical protein NKH57_20720 [Mesorhizobium sp. M1050]|uniref:hypothetical protein n=1 Tax=Mesorhizobium sp. M1050 TaxID=2957051 RepID=UPI003338DB38
MAISADVNKKRTQTLAGEAMAKTAEDNFRIEVWDRDEQALSETISRSLIQR